MAAVDQGELAEHLFTQLGVERPSSKLPRIYHLSDPGGPAIYADATHYVKTALNVEDFAVSQVEHWSGYTSFHVTYEEGGEKRHQVLLVVGFGPCPVPLSTWERVLDDTRFDE
jgi:hypothetical protein